MSKQTEFTAIQLDMLITMTLEYSEMLTIELISIHISNNHTEINNMIKDVLLYE